MKANYFLEASELLKFIDKNNIRREDIITITHSGVYTLFYY